MCRKDLHIYIVFYTIHYYSSVHSATLCLFSPTIYHDLSIFIPILYCIMGRDSSVGIATRYGLHGPWIASRWG